MAVFPWPTAGDEMAVVHEKVKVGRGDQDSAG
jgi:hypothetical protein